VNTLDHNGRSPLFEALEEPERRDLTQPPTGFRKPTMQVKRDFEVTRAEDELHQARPGFEAWFGLAPHVDEALRALVAADIPHR